MLSEIHLVTVLPALLIVPDLVPVLPVILSGTMTHANQALAVQAFQLDLHHEPAYTAKLNITVHQSYTALLLSS